MAEKLLLSLELLEKMTFGKCAATKSESFFCFPFGLMYFLFVPMDSLPGMVHQLCFCSTSWVHLCAE
jgi:hypothetical protein